jgi:hypothetical protein
MTDDACHCSITQLSLTDSHISINADALVVFVFLEILYFLFAILAFAILAFAILAVTKIDYQ